MKGRQFLWALPLAVLGCRCGGKASPEIAVFGAYTIEATCVRAFAMPRDYVGIGMLMGIGIRRREKPVVYTIAPTGMAGQARVSDDMGCSFVGELEEGVVTARSTPCDPISPGTQLALVGVERQLKQTFSLDAVRGTLHEYNTNDIIYAGGAQERNYLTCEGHVQDGKPTPSGSSLVTYDGRVKCPYEQEASLGCKPVPNGPNDYTNGTLMLRYGQSKNELIVYEEGVGCTVTARSDDGVVFRADGADCQLAKIGISELGVTSRHFDSYVLDFGAKTWNHSSTILRNDGSGATMIQCQVATTQITGNLPK